MSATALTVVVVAVLALFLIGGNAPVAAFQTASTRPIYHATVKANTKPAGPSDQLLLHRAASKQEVRVAHHIRAVHIRHVKAVKAAKARAQAAALAAQQQATQQPSTPAPAPSSAAPAPTPTPTPPPPPSGSGVLSYGQIESLWVSAGGPASVEATAANIAECESGGNPQAQNPSGASGIWQILGQVVAGNIFDPMVNALNAVAKYNAAGGFSPWVCQG